MPKKRVYELAKELGLESKVLMARLEKIGIPVKTASASLDDDELERAKKELTAGELREVVEQRIKTTVIRRRTVVTAVEIPVEESPEEEAKHPEKESAEDKLKKAPAAKAKKEKTSEAPAGEHGEKIPKVEAAKTAEQPMADAAQTK
jgi:translation initiation factor IF-2